MNIVILIAGVLIMSKNTTVVLIFAVAMLAAALFIRGGEVMTALIVNSENSSQVTVSVNSQAPTCEGTVCYDADETTDNIDLQGGSERFVKCNTTCTDPNGWGNMINFTGNITTGSAACTASNVNCYVNMTCQNVTEKNTTAQDVECSWQFRYNAINTSKSGTWTFTAYAGDADGLKSSATTDTIALSELLAIGVDPTIAFGNKNANTNDSTCSIADNVYNYGNIQIDFQVNSSAQLSCGTGTISAEYIKANLTSGGFYQPSYALGTALGGPDTGSKFNSNLAANSTATTEYPQAPIKPTYWGIGVPGGVGGACSGYIWFAAVNS
jgi:hypothetical protein